MSTEVDVQRAPVPVWLFSSPEAIEAFVERASDIRTGNTEYDLFLVEVAGVIEECVSDSRDWIRRNFVGTAALLPKLHQHYVTLHPQLRGTYQEHFGHWLLRDAFPEQRSLPKDIWSLLQEVGFCGPLALLAADGCLLMLKHWQAIERQPTMELKAAAMQAALTAYSRAAQALAFSYLLVQPGDKTSTSIANSKAQRRGQLGFLELKRQTLALWREGLADGRWSYGQPGGKAPRGKGPRYAAKVIAHQLIEVAADVLRGKHRGRGIALGSDDQVYRWILEAREDSPNV